jgi:hypothetical protein
MTLQTQTTRMELHLELRRVLGLLETHFNAQRETEERASENQLLGLAIDDSEAQRLIAELSTAVVDRSVIEREDLDGVSFAPTESPLRRACRVFRLSSFEQDATVLALAVELDARFGRVIAYLNDHLSRTRPTVGLVRAVNGGNVDAVEFCAGAGVGRGLLQLDGDGPLPSRAIRLAPEFVARLAGVAEARATPSGVRLLTNALPIDELAIDRAQCAKLREWARRLQDNGAAPPLVLAGPAGAGRATAAHAASASAGRALVKCRWACDRADLPGIAVREAIWHHATLLVRLSEGVSSADVAALWSSLSAADVPIAVALSVPDVDVVCAAAPDEPVVVTLDGTTIEQRERLWEKLLPSAAAGAPVRISVADRRELATRYDFAPGALVRAVRRAAAERADPNEALDVDAISRACRAVGSAAIGPIAHRLVQPYTRSDLVLPRELLEELDLASAWMRHGRRVFEDWGFGRRIVLGRGLTALFTGAPGTGKTMAAQVLARDLGLDLFRVDLSRVMSKYIGETEKNLSRLFDDARASGAMLFFDEADALFGKRTEVKDAHDRYANLEIGYLLQRMEEHTGTTILATNRFGDLDEAFTRRFHFIVHFPIPRAPERRRIWEGMLPREAERDPAIDFDLLAEEYEISGGDIRNSVLTAAFLAAEEGTPIGLRHLKRGLRRELLKTGRVLDARQRRSLD